MGGVIGCTLRPRHPKPIGEHAIGILRERLPGADGSDKSGLLAQVHYPVDPHSPEVSGHACSWFRDEVLQCIGEGYNINPRALRSLLGGVRSLDAARPPLSASSSVKTERWPVVVFTSGLWGCCEMYTQFCRDLASCGAIVIALEHEDGSGIYARRAGDDEPIAYNKPPGSGSIVEFRHPFLEQRVQELDSSTKAIIAASAGNNPDGADTSSKTVSLLSQVLEGADPDRMVLVGHSFGSAGILRYVRRISEQGSKHPYKGIMLMDMWPDPLTDEDLKQDLQAPFSVVMSEHWVEYESYMESHEKLIKSNAKSILLGTSIVGTTHQWISESQLFAPGWLLRKMDLMGSLPWPKVYGATAKLCDLTLQALLKPEEHRQDLRKKVSEIDPDVIKFEFE
eukprot:CAMPEP_0206432732 /NCGR_PEP_ID=MMETSP0324_2-20121206/8129_1 /ASSEMBLY_ACC=CAM_ASM_000836 /TAXON_ID=2866 /ORGANISM="Crypthecodinium cohnii, Strain Seligo" /LENGTH=394 /DNA_ID=CAMNT_0053898895 /DNA_START=47 /DNA_END=1231 /DNA_ORIENTATION=+